MTPATSRLPQIPLARVMTRNLLAATVGWHLTTHAKHAAGSRGFTAAQALVAATDPDVRHEQHHRGKGRFICQRGEVAVVVHLPSQTILTVLWRHEQPWTDHQALHRDAA